MLTAQRIEELSQRQGARKIAVENFLSTLHGLTMTEAMMNLELDARLYGWKEPTISAISRGIGEFFNQA